MHPTWSSEDTKFMARAIQLAKKGLYSTHPNPRVGCVLVRNNEVVGEGFHERAGEPHAEVYALRQAGERANGAVAYVTLEPCSHYGKTPPCADALISAGVSRVVVAMTDPNPQVSGAGLERIAQAGIQVDCGLLEAQAEALNPGFIKRMRVGRPYVRLKMAMSLDGRTAMQSGESQWITGPDARSDVQKIRAQSSAILTGLGTAKFDDPKLTIRGEDLLSARRQQPMRIVLDKQGELDGNERVFSDDADVLYITAESIELASSIAAKPRAEHVALALNHEGSFDLSELLTMLADRQVNELLVEAGAGIAGSFIEQSCVDELIIYIAPQLMGSEARPLADLKIDKMVDAKHLDLCDSRMIGKDLKLTYRFKEA